MQKFLLLTLCLILTACGGGGGGGGSSAGTSSTASNASVAVKVVDIATNTNTAYNTAVGDLNGDGLEDVVVSGWSYDKSTSPIWVLIQNTNGTLTDRTTELLGTTTTGGSQHVFIADFDNDGRNDIFVPGFRDGSSMLSTNSVMFWNSGGTFTRQVFAEQVMAHGACIDDMNRDGKIDLLVAGEFGASILYVNNGNRTFTADTVTLSNNWFSTCGVVHQDNGDVNILMGNNRNLTGYTSVIAVYNQTLQFQNYIGVTSPTGADLINSAVFDANGDGRKDFILINAGTPTRRVLLNSSTNTFSDGVTLDSLGSDYYTEVATVNGNPAVLLPVSGQAGTRLYVQTNGVMTAYLTSSFTTMAGTSWSQAHTIYNNATTGKIYMLQLLNTVFYTKEL
jgi:hypothetical protein